MTSTSRLLALVHGDVQGVGFRYFIQRRAQAAGLRGVVRNLDSGDVECVAEGSRDALEELLAALRQGPRGATVDGVDAEWEEARGDLEGFQVD